MDIEHKKNATAKQQVVEELDRASATAETIMDRGAEFYEQAEQAVSDVYDKTAQAVSDTYDQAKSYSSENPGKTILIALGIGVGLGYLLGASTHRSRTGWFARPVVNAISDFALGFFR